MELFGVWIFLSSTLSFTKLIQWNCKWSSVLFLLLSWSPEKHLMYANFVHLLYFNSALRYLLSLLSFVKFNLKEMLIFCTLSLITGMHTIIYEILQHYYDELCSHESWSSLLTSLLAENSGGAGAFQVLRQSVRKKVVLKDETIAKYLVVSSCSDAKIRS